MILTSEALTKTYHGNTVVNNLSFTLEKQKCIALIGPNGAGKTTTLRMLAGLIQPTSGKIEFTKGEKDVRHVIGYLPQHPVFHEWMTGEEFLIYAGRLAYLNKTEGKERALQLLRVTGIYEAKDKPISAYSGGMKQRLGIAQALIHRPQLLMLDEPVSALDPAGRREILSLIDTLKHEMTILFSTHILSDADEVCDDLLLLRQGELIESGPMSLLREKYQSSKIELHFTEGTEDIQDILLALNTVTAVAKIRGIYHLTVTDIHKAREEILQSVLMHNWTLDSFQINRTSLEDMFMKAVNS